ncbi:MAG TPA: hypothetical protein DD677_09020 [Stenotrophomonas sp.]|uniref:YjeF C-terminal domain-containing protein n=1 Tax=Stenotrophomonas maltophilia TaxID=40324 RepID=A0AAI9FSI9_STEMA|nr:hypothetical protein [Stenotrophomonas maltophilia]HBP03259.1 hypothetical protein [Stenotrophomonas sp.]
MSFSPCSAASGARPFRSRIRRVYSGRVLVIGGSAKVPGAVLLAGKAALNAGGGKLHIATARSLAGYRKFNRPFWRV